MKIGKDADRSEVETIYNISQNNPDLNFRRIFKGYLKDKMGHTSATALIFRDDNLQRVAFEDLKFNKGWDKF